MVAATGIPSAVAGANVSRLAVRREVSRKTSGPDSKRVLTTRPLASTSTRMLTSPCFPDDRASSGYSSAICSRRRGGSIVVAAGVAALDPAGAASAVSTAPAFNAPTRTIQPTPTRNGFLLSTERWLAGSACSRFGGGGRLIMSAGRPIADTGHMQSVCNWSDHPRDLCCSPSKNTVMSIDAISARKVDVESARTVERGQTLPHRADRRSLASSRSISTRRRSRRIRRTVCVSGF